VVWGNEVFGKPFHDNWWQTETGGIMIANTRAMDIKPGRWASRCPGSMPPSSQRATMAR
jgi:acetyl-CoA synthetase